MFTIENISKSYEKKQILDNISFTVNPGSIVGILGVNGSGKSTLLNEIVRKYSADKEIRLGYLPQENPLFEELKPIDNIRFWCSLDKSEIIEALSKPPLFDMGIIDFLNTPVRKMSGGMKKRLSLAAVLINQPRLLLMDEPFAALDLIAKQDVLSYIRSYISSDGAVIITSHEEEIFNMCDTVYLLDKGKLHDTDGLSKNGRSYIDILRGNYE